MQVLFNAARFDEVTFDEGEVFLGNSQGVFDSRASGLYLCLPVCLCACVSVYVCASVRCSALRGGNSVSSLNKCLPLHVLHLLLIYCSAAAFKVNFWRFSETANKMVIIRSFAIPDRAVFHRVSTAHSCASHTSKYFPQANPRSSSTYTHIHTHTHTLSLSLSRPLL